MSLTPEDRARIHEEERERFEAQKRLKSEARSKVLRNVLIAAGVLAAVVILIGIGAVSTEKPAEKPKPVARVMVDEVMWLRDGEAKSYKLDPGTYRVEMTSSGDGCSIECIGSDAPASGATSTYSQLIELKRTGQVIVTNPTVFGTGASASVTMKVTKLPAAG